MMQYSQDNQDEQTEISEAQKIEIRQLKESGIGIDIIASFFGITPKDIETITDQDNITIEEVLPPEEIVLPATEAIQESFLSNIKPIKSGTSKSSQPLASRDEIRAFAKIATTAVVECGSVTPEEDAISRLKKELRPLLEVARDNKIKNHPELANKPKAYYIPFSTVAYLSPKEQIAARRLQYQIDELEKKTAPVVDCQMQEVQKELEAKGYTVIRSKGGKGTLILPE